MVLLSKLKDAESRKRYAERAIEHTWSRNVLNIHIETRLLEREGNTVTNFEANLPKPHSDLARESLKDPYLFDLLTPYNSGFFLTALPDETMPFP